MNFENLLRSFRQGGNDAPYISIKGQQALLEEQFERYGIDMCDVLQLLKQDNLQIKPHSEGIDDHHEVHGQSIDGEKLILIVSTSGNTIKLINVWLDQ